MTSYQACVPKESSKSKVVTAVTLHQLRRFGCKILYLLYIPFTLRSLTAPNREQTSA